ncbi:fimbrial protein [Salmonella enterica]|uniref:Fimbrial protein n=1 Tax=Salmonella enterica TaxID=28901 RepID=A0A749PMP3_SALER|nr:fimbrial protein [Salmonella enterica]EDV4744987.1 fimbrial protein [Salmonella enterica subsp. enterica serovar Javiana]EBR5819130.1 fimbrial protein [Salmonella enterica]EEF8371282.1 fimbrial protein [Salmonella enterica]EEF9333147.1 fimbrial protein [Salmonella enterica]
MNNIMCGKMKEKAVRLIRGFSRQFSLLSLIMVCVLVLPWYVYASDWDTSPYGCIADSGSDNVTLNLPPSISFPPENAPGIGQVIYQSSEYRINFKCKSKVGGYLILQRLGDLVPLQNALDAAGLTLEFEVKNSADSFSVIYEPLTSPDQFSVSNYYGSTIEGVLSVRFLLKVKRTSTATFSAVPGLSAFKLNALTGGGGYPGIRINTTPFRIQYVPTCFVRTSLGTNNVNFGPVLTTDADNSFSRTIPFNVTANVNENCGKGNLQGVYTVNVTGGTTDYYLELPLKVTFILNNGGEVALDRKSILLYTDKNNKKLKNGLRLKINTPDGNPVTFNEVSLPVNKFGDFHGSPKGGVWNISNIYNAVLSSTGEQVITGKYQAQVTVKVDYY